MSDPHIKTITGIDPDVKIKEELFVDEGLTAAEYEQKIPLSPNIKGEELDIKKEAFYEEDEDSATSNIITDDPEIDPDFTVTTASTAGRRRKLMMSDTSESSTGAKKRRSCLSSQPEFLGKRKKGLSAYGLMKNYNIAKSTSYNVLNSKDESFEPTRSQNSKTNNNIRAFDKPPTALLDEQLHQWILGKHSEGMPVSGPMIIAKAECLNEDLNLGLRIKFGYGWLRAFRERCEMGLLDNDRGNKSPINENATSKFRSSFQSILKKNGFTAEQVYAADETAINWKCLPTKTLASFPQETNFKDNNEQLTVLTCANTSGQHKLKLLLVGKKPCPVFKILSCLTVTYKYQRYGLMSKEIFKEWFFDIFVPSVHENFEKLGMAKNSKCVLLIDNCNSHPCETELVSDCGNIYACYFPPNVTGLNPMNWGVIKNFKCNYKNNFLLHMIHKNVIPQDFQHNFSIKDAMYLLQSSWDAVKVSILLRAWNHLWAHSTNEDELETNKDPETLNSSIVEKGIQMIFETLKLAPIDDPLNNLGYNDLKEWINTDHYEHRLSFTDEQIDANVTDMGDNSSSSCQGEDICSKEGITWTSVEKAIEDVIKFMECKPIFDSDDCMKAQMLQKSFIIKKLKELKLDEMKNVF